MKKVLLVLITLTLCGCAVFNEDYNETEIDEVPILLSLDSDEKIYLATYDEKTLPTVTKDEFDEEIHLSYKSSDKKILNVNKNIIKGLKEGVTTLKVTTSKKEEINIEVIVTSLITKKEINNDKPYIKCGEYTEEETTILEEILESRINEGGYHTRAGALNAARFLILEFKSGLKYFNENGRLENHSNILHVDGEGRYYHKGLYIAESKYDSITASTASGPKMWGCSLLSVHYNKYMDNGFNCSGFITWALYNAGYDIKDVGAGDFDYIKNELLDLRPKEPVSLELLQSGKIKSGDLIGFDGHIAMIIGLEKNTIYVGESYETGLRVRTFNYQELIDSDFTDIILMDEFYGEEGNYTNMW